MLLQKCLTPLFCVIGELCGLWVNRVWRSVSCILIFFHSLHNSFFHFHVNSCNTINAFQGHRCPLYDRRLFALPSTVTCWYQIKKHFWISNMVKQHIQSEHTQTQMYYWSRPLTNSTFSLYWGVIWINIRWFIVVYFPPSPSSSNTYMDTHFESSGLDIKQTHC